MVLVVFYIEMIMKILKAWECINIILELRNNKRIVSIKALLSLKLAYCIATGISNLLILLLGI